MFEQTCNFLWNRALVQEGLAWGQLKIAMDQSKVQQLYSSTRRDMVRLVHEAELGPESTLGGSDLFYMVVNHFFHSELGREFRLPVGALPVHRLNTQGRVRIPQGSSQRGRLHDNVYLESLLLCLMDVSGVAEMAAWLPIHVTRAAIAQAMKNMRRRQVKKLAEWKAQGYEFQQIFYGALYALLEGGLIAGEVRRGRGTSGPRIAQSAAQRHRLVLAHPGFPQQPKEQLQWRTRRKLKSGCRDHRAVSRRFRRSPPK